MKIKLKEIVNNEPLINAISHKQGLGIKISYALSKNISKIEREIEIYNKEKAKLIEKYGSKNDEGNYITDTQGNIKFNNLDDWNKAIIELLELEVDIDIHKISLEDIYNGACDITPAEFIAINFMIEE